MQINLKEVKVVEELDLKSIARKLDGYRFLQDKNFFMFLNEDIFSGADITNVCRDASMMSMRRRIAGLKPSEIRSLGRDELDMPVTKQGRNICRLGIYLLMSFDPLQDFLEAVQKCNKSVSKEDLDKYEKWMEEFGSS